MAHYRIIGWKDIPSAVEAYDDERMVRVTLSQRFQDLIDGVAMREGATETETYLDGWAAGPESERPGGPDEVAGAVAAKLEAEFQELAHRRLSGSP